MHLRRLAEQHFHRHVDGLELFSASFCVVDQLATGALPSRRRPRRPGSARASQMASKAGRIVRRDGENVTFLRFVRPDLARRQARFLQAALAQFETRALARAIDQFRERVRQPARAHVVDAQNRVFCAQLPARIDDFLRAPLDFRIAALDGVEIEFARCSCRSPWNLPRRRPCRSACPDRRSESATIPPADPCLCVCWSEILPIPPAIMIGL